MRSIFPFALSLLLWAAPATAKPQGAGPGPSEPSGPAPSGAPAPDDGPSSADRETARKLMDKGKRHYEAREFSKALEAFRGADKIMGVTSTGLWVGKTLVRLGRLIEARDKLYKVSQIAEPPDENPILAEARQEAAALQLSIADRIPEVTLKLEGWDGEREITVLLDGDELRTDVVTLPRSLDPGAHEVVVQAPAYATVRLSFSIAEGQQKTLRLMLTPGSGESDQTPEASGADPDGARGTISPLVWVGFSIAGAGVIVGSITGPLSLSAASSAKDFCDDNGDNCDPAGQDDADRSLALGHVSTASFAIAGAGAVLGIVGLFLGGEATEEPDAPAAESGRVTVEPLVGPTFLGLQGTF